MPMVGDVLADRYEIEGILGAGGMATVYQAIDLRLQREVAVKVLLPGLAADSAVAARFEREARSLAGAAHHGIVAVFDVEAGDQATGREPFYVMELCDGGSLADRLEEAGSLTPPDVIPTIAAIAEGLDAMHAQGLLHRDVKPHNILFCGGRPKLGDFGLARSEHRAELARLTADGTTVGTLPYLAPELLAGAAPTQASDVYGLGATAYQALTGQLPRPLGSLKDMIDDRGKMPAPASSVIPELRPFDPVLAEGLAVDPAARPSPTDFAGRLGLALEDWLSAPAGSADPPAEEPADAAKTAAIAIATVPSPAPVTAQTETVLLPVAEQEPEPEPQVAPVAPRAPARPPRPMPGFRIDPQLQRRLLAVAGGIVGLAAFVVIAAILSRTLDTSGFFDVGAFDRSPGASESAAPSPTPTAAASNPALEAVNDVLAAIDAARGGSNGLKGSEANELTNLATRVRSALQAGDFEEAREAAASLKDRAEKFSKDLGDDRKARLLDAIDALREAIPED